jgi:hypothetical protein
LHASQLTVTLGSDAATVTVPVPGSMQGLRQFRLVAAARTDDPSDNIAGLRVNGQTSGYRRQIWRTDGAGNVYNAYTGTDGSTYYFGIGSGSGGVIEATLGRYSTTWYLSGQSWSTSGAGAQWQKLTRFGGLVASGSSLSSVQFRAPGGQVWRSGSTFSVTPLR